MKKIDYQIKVMEAFRAGEKIEKNPIVELSGWADDESPEWNWGDFNYRIKSRLYCAGQRFMNRNNTYILASISSDTACLINLATGNRYSDPVRVEDIRKITQREFNAVSSGGNWKEIKND